MAFIKNITFIPNNEDDRVVFGRVEAFESTFQILDVTGFGRNGITEFKNEAIDSQTKVFLGNKLPLRSILLKASWQHKGNKIEEQSLLKLKEDTVRDLITKFSTVDIQNKESLGRLEFETFGGAKYEIRQVIAKMNIDNSQRKQNPLYATFNIEFNAMDPHVYFGTNRTDFGTEEPEELAFSNNETYVSTELQAELQAELQLNQFQVKNGYITNKGIVFYKDEYGVEQELVDGGMYFKKSDFNKEVSISGTRTYPTWKIIIGEGVLENPRLINTTTGREVSFQLELIKGDELTVDFENKTALRKRGEIETDVRDLMNIESSWVYLKRGANNIIQEFATISGDYKGQNYLEWDIKYEGVDS